MAQRKPKFQLGQSVETTYGQHGTIIERKESLVAEPTYHVLHATRPEGQARPQWFGEADLVRANAPPPVLAALAAGPMQKLLARRKSKR